MRILGIDPGTRFAGYGLIDLNAGQFKPIAAGVWRLPAERPLCVRLGQLHLELLRLIDGYRPETLCLELAFVADNPRSALSLGHARGVILAGAHLAGLEVHEMSATAAKKSITGFGRADKSQVALSLQRLLGVDTASLPLDASDALALAYAHGLREMQRDAGSASSSSGASAHWGQKSRKKQKDFSVFLKEAQK